MTKAFLEKYGNPDSNGDGILDPAWFLDNIRVFALPFPMVLSWQPTKTILRFQAHKFAGDKIIAALTDILDKYSLDYLRQGKLDRWGGCFNFRLIRGGHELSMHSWGTAVDINPDIGRLGNAHDAVDYPGFIIEAFEKQGFVWGGVWQRPDAQHFQLEA